jgi:hypothetical protein
MNFPRNYTRSYGVDEFNEMIRQAHRDGFVYYPLQGYDLKKYEDDLWWGYCTDKLDNHPNSNGIWIISQDPFQTQLLMIFSDDRYTLLQAIDMYRKELEVQKENQRKRLTTRKKIDDIIRRSHNL